MAKNKNISVDNYYNGADALKDLIAPRPSTVEGQLSEATWYYQHMLTRKIANIFRIEDCPDEWNLDYFWYTLLREGYIGVVDTPAGVLPLRCGYSGVNPFNMPTHVTVANHCFPETLYREIGKDAVLMYLEYLPWSHAFQPVGNIIRKYSVLLANCDAAINVNLINSKVAYIFDCEDEAQANTAKAIYDDISSGKPAVFKRSSSPSLNSDGSVTWTVNNVKSSYIAQDVQDTKRSIMSEFWTDIGIDNSPVDKKERVNTEEVVSNNMQLTASVYDWYRNLDKLFTRVNSIFNLNIKFSMPYYNALEKLREGVNENATVESGRPDENV